MGRTQSLYSKKNIGILGSMWMYVELLLEITAHGFLKCFERHRIVSVPWKIFYNLQVHYRDILLRKPYFILSLIFPPKTHHMGDGSSDPSLKLSSNKPIECSLEILLVNFFRISLFPPNLVRLPSNKSLLRTSGWMLNYSV